MAHRLAASLLAIALLLGGSVNSDPPRIGGSIPLARAMPVQGAGSARALIVGIGQYGIPPADYPTPGRRLKAYTPLAGARDAEVMATALQRFGFSPENITTVLDQEATLEGLRRHFVSFTASVEEGDDVVVHFSGHGHQIADEDRPLEEGDGYDELLVPYGAPNEWFEGYDGSLHLRDDEFGAFVQDLRRRAGPAGSVTVFVDACFSGTSLRSPLDLPVRGANSLGDPAPGAVQLRREIGLDDGPEDPATLADYVVISAAAHDQIAREVLTGSGTETLGPLTYGLAASLSRLNDKATYQDLMVLVRQSLGRKVDLAYQTPLIEGAETNRLFSNVRRPVRPFLVIDSIVQDPERDPLVAVQGGRLLGLAEDSQIGFYPLDAPGPTGEPVAKATVVSASASRAWARMDGDDDPELALRLRAYQLSSLYANKLRVRVSDSISANVKTDLEIGLLNEPLSETVDSLPHLTVLPGRAGALVLRFTDEGRADEEVGPQHVLTRLAELGRLHFFRELDIESDELDVDVEVLPQTLVPDAPGGCRPDTAVQFSEGAFQMSRRNAYRLRVRNPNSWPIWVTGVDLNPDGTLYPTLEMEDLPGAPTSEEVPAGRDVTTWCIGLSEVPGPLSIKLLITTDRLDLGPVFGRSLRDTHSAASLLTQFLDQGVRGLRSPVPAGLGVTTTLRFEVAR